MLNIELSFSELLEAVISRLQYFAAKRSTNKEEYFCFTACKADLPMLRQLALECLAEISSSLGWYSSGFYLRNDSLIFTVKTKKGCVVTEEKVLEMSTLLRLLLINAIIFRWLLLAGCSEGDGWKVCFNTILQIFSEHLSRSLPVCLRALHPL